MALDYVGSYSATHGDNLLHFGTKGMKWGIRNSNKPVGASQAKSDHLKVMQRLTKSDPKDTGKVKVPVSTKEIESLVSFGKEQQASKTLQYQLNESQASKFEATYKAAKSEAKKSGSAKIDYNDLKELVNHGRLLENKKNPKPDLKKNLKKEVKDEVKGEVKDRVRDGLFNYLLMSDDITKNDYVGAYLRNPSDISHFGTKGMKWGIRNTEPGSGKASGSSKSQYVPPSKNMGDKAVTAFVAKNKRPPVAGEPMVVRDSANSQLHVFNGIKGKPVHVETVGYDKITKRPTQVLWAKKTGLEKLKTTAKYAALLGIGLRLAIVAAGGIHVGDSPIGSRTDGPFGTDPRGIIEAGDPVTPNDYIGAAKAKNSDVLHYGVKGMKWGVRSNSKITVTRSKSIAPTRARKREEADLVRTKEAQRLSGLRERVAEGKSTVSRNGKKLSTDEAIKAIDNDIAKLTKKNVVVDRIDESNKKILAELPPPANAQKSILKKDIEEGESSVERYNRLRAEVLTKGAKSLEDEDLRFLNSRREAVSKASAAYNTKNSKLRKLVMSTIDTAASKLLKDATQGLVTKHIVPKLHNKLNIPIPNPPTPTPTPTP